MPLNIYCVSELKSLLQTPLQARAGICSSIWKKIVISAHVDAQTRVRWWRDEILLAESSFGQEQQSSKRITLYSNGSLRVHHVQREDSGPYVCQAIRPSPWGHVTQVHEIEVMCEYIAACIYPTRLPCNVPGGKICLLYIETDRRVERILEFFANPN